MEKDVDFFDIILEYGFNKGYLMKIERVENLKESEPYYSVPINRKKIVDELLDIYLNTNIMSLEKIDVFKQPNFYPFGGYVPTVKELGGKQDCQILVKELINKLYEHIEE